MMYSEKQNDTSKFNLMKMPTRKKNTLLKNVQANAESNFFKRVFFSPPKNPPFLFLQIYFSQRTGFVHNRTDIASNIMK